MTDAAPVIKETKAQRQERLKRELNPWEAFDQVRAFAREGRQSVTPEWAGAYFKWWGIYTQGDGAGALGGKGGEGVATEYFMMRIGIPNGIVNATQLRVIADITKKHARNLADITVRQNIQLHWLTIEDIPEVVRALDASACHRKAHAETSSAMSPAARSPASRMTSSSIHPRSPSPSRMSSQPIPTSTTSHANSKSPSPAAPSGAPIPRSMTSA